MPAPIKQLIGAIACPVALLVLGAGVGVPAGTAQAADCVTAPNAPAPANGHWYYRTDRVAQRKCWYLRAADQGSQQVAAQSSPPQASSVPAAGSYSLASFKEFIVRRGGAKLPDKDVETLYTQFLAWNRRPKD